MPPVGDPPPPTCSGIHVDRHPPLHWRLDVVSPFQWYSVRPWAFTSTVPTPFAFPVFTVSTATPFGLPPPPPAAGPLGPLFPPHAASRSTAATPTPKILFMSPASSPSKEYETGPRPDGG